MKTNEFCYWLQGFFELNVNVDEINQIQLSLIKGHLRLVSENEKVLTGFPLWLSAFLQGLEQGVGGELVHLSRSTTRKIEEQLASYFNHVIDHSYEKSAEDLRKAHPSLSGLIHASGQVKINC